MCEWKIKRVVDGKRIESRGKDMIVSKKKGVAKNIEGGTLIECEVVAQERDGNLCEWKGKKVVDGKRNRDRGKDNK